MSLIRTASLQSAIIVILQHRTIIGVSDADHLCNTLTRRLISQVSNAVLSYDDVSIMLRDIDMRAVRNNAGNCTLLRSGQSNALISFNTSLFSP